MMTVVWR